MRITFNMQAMKFDSSISGALEALNSAADRVNKKQNLLTPEQSPSNYVGAYNIQRMIDEITQFSKNAETANGWLGNASKQLESALKALQNAKNDFALGGLDSAQDADSRLAMADEVKKIYESIMSSANSSYLDRYIFGGYLTSTPPFSQSSNGVSGVISSAQNGSGANSSSIFSDLKELSSGKYKATITVENGVGKLTITDSSGKQVMLDNNGSDQAGGKGNNSSGELLFEFKPGAVINTGRGVSMKMPDTANQSFTIDFNYQSGSEMAYNGDSNSIFAKIGYNQDIALNMPGSSIFSQDYKTFLSSSYFTTNGRPAGLGTYFSSLDKTNVSLGDSIKITGTDHSGKPIGSASVLSALNPKLDQTNTTVEERTLKLTYGNKVYQVVLPQAAYKSTEELSSAINDQLQFAEFLGTIEMPAGGFPSVSAYKDNVQNLMNSDYFQPATNSTDAKNKQVDLRKNISIANDGDRLTFTTGDVGNNVLLAVSGGKSSSLGFQNITLVAQGKDNVFELAFDFNPNGIEKIGNTHTGVDFTAARANRDYEFVINGKRIKINIPTPTYAATVTTTNNDLSGATDGFSITLQGKTINVPKNVLLAATTMADKTDVINKYINDAGFGGQYNVTLSGAAATATIDLHQQTAPTKKDIEFQLNDELRKAGITDVTASLSTISGSGNAALGNFNLSFDSVNNNLGKSTQITSTYIDNTTVPPTYDFQTDKQDKTGQNNTTERTLGDYVKFLQSLYGEGVSVSLIDGKVQLQDNISGSSRLTMSQQPSNTGVGMANDFFTVLGGKYTGAADTTWNFTVNTELQTNGSRTVSITIRDIKNNIVFDERFSNYLGGEIDLPFGVKINPNDMTVPATGNSRTTTFSTKLTANANLSMGDMKMTSDGTSVNIFRELKNLENALRYNITANGFATPSSWKNNTLSNSAKPFFDGLYRGNNNDNWRYEVLQSGGKTDYYLQNEYKSTTGDIKFDQNLINNNGNIGFNIDIYDNTSSSSKSIPININLANAFPPLTDAKSTQDYIISQLNNNATLKSEGITFSGKSGKIEMSSNNGTKIASLSEQIDVAPNARKTEFTRYILGLDTVANSKVTFPLTLGAAYNFTVFDIFEPNAAIGVTKNMSIAAGTYNTSEDLITALNAQLATAGAGGTDGRITASMGADGSIVFKAADGTIARSTYNGLPADNSFGIAGSNTLSSMGPKGLQLPKLDLSTADDSARTLKFNYIDKNGKQASTTIQLDKKSYASNQEMADEINRLITAGGVLNGQVTAKVTTDGMLTFQTSNVIAAGDTAPTARGLTVEGDYNGSLGFPKTGDSIKLKVTSEDGTGIQEIVMNVANKTSYIADGLYLGFDKGTIKVADFFTGAVGSGIEKTISALEKAEKQVLTASSQFGSRETKIETVITFNKTIIETNEKTKSSYLGSTASDIAKAVTDLQMATTAYEAALTATNKLLSVSLLNFLR